MTKEIYDVFLSHSHADAAFVEKVAEQLEDENQLKSWLDKWVVVPGGSFQQAITKGLEDAKSCAVFLGANTAGGWFEKEYEAALNRQAQDKAFRVIPVLVPGADPKTVNVFLQLNDWVDFRDETKSEYMMYRLVCGIKGVSPGRYKPPSGSTTAT